MKKISALLFAATTVVACVGQPLPSLFRRSAEATRRQQTKTGNFPQHTNHEDKAACNIAFAYATL